jgi:hypothetical protein
MVSPRYVYPWWGRNMVDDHEKTHTLNWTIQETRSMGKRTTQRKKQKKRKKNSLQITFITVPTCKLE